MGTQYAAALSLRLDAVYCALGAVAVALFGARFGLAPGAALAGAGAVALWALGLHLASLRCRLRPWLVGVLVANVAASALIAALAVARPWAGWATVLLLAVAAEVAAFAVAQATALRRGAA
jgi:hypothetical protein